MKSLITRWNLLPLKPNPFCGGVGGRKEKRDQSAQTQGGPGGHHPHSPPRGRPHLSGGQGHEVLHRLGHGLAEQPDDDAARVLLAQAEVEENLVGGQGRYPGPAGTQRAGAGAGAGAARGPLSAATSGAAP